MSTTSVAIALAVGAMCQSSDLLQSTPSDPVRRTEPARHGPSFHAPVRVQVDGEAVRVESPGWAAPCWADVDGDGDDDLLVGQFAGGKIRVYENDGDGKLGEGRWLEAGGQIATVPGVW